MKRRIIHLHGKGISSIVSNSPLKRYLYNLTFRGCEVVHLSPLLLNDIAEIDIMKLHIVNNGVPDQFLPNVSKKYDFIFLSNLLAFKGIYVFVDALCLIARTNPRFTCAIVGWGSEMDLKEIFKKLNDADISDRVSVLGPMYAFEKRQILNFSKVFVLPSFNEAFPLAILEAMSAGLPVISTKVGGIPDIVEHEKTGFLLEKNTSEELASAMRSLLVNDDLILNMGDAGRKAYLNKFSEKSFTDSMLSIFIDN